MKALEDNFECDRAVLSVAVGSDDLVCLRPDVTRLMAGAARAVICLCAERVIGRIYDLMVNIGNELAREQAAADAVTELAELARQVDIGIRAQAALLLQQDALWNTEAFAERERVAKVLRSVLQDIAEASTCLAGDAAGEGARETAASAEDRVREAARVASRPIVAMGELLGPALSALPAGTYRTRLHAFWRAFPSCKSRPES